MQAWTKEAQAHPASDNRSSSRLRSAEFRALWGESGAGSSQPGPSSTEEPIRWNRVRRRSSTRAARPAVDSAGADDDVIFCPTPEESKYQSVNGYQGSDAYTRSFLALSFNIISIEFSVFVVHACCVCGTSGDVQDRSSFVLPCKSTAGQSAYSEALAQTHRAMLQCACCIGSAGIACDTCHAFVQFLILGCLY